CSAGIPGTCMSSSARGRASGSVAARRTTRSSPPSWSTGSTWATSSPASSAPAPPSRSETSRTSACTTSSVCSAPVARSTSSSRCICEPARAAFRRTAAGPWIAAGASAALLRAGARELVASLAMHASEQRYPVLRSKVDAAGEVFRGNRTQNLETLARLDKALARSRAGGGEKYVARHVGAGKLLPRQRIEMLLDRDAHFL